jgi:hypothetical protein
MSEKRCKIKVKIKRLLKELSVAQQCSLSHVSSDVSSSGCTLFFVSEHLIAKSVDVIA